MSLQGLIFVNWYDHPAEHWADFYLGRSEAVVALRDAVEANPSLEEMVRKEFGTLYNG